MEPRANQYFVGTSSVRAVTNTHLDHFQPLVDHHNEQIAEEEARQTKIIQDYDFARDNHLQAWKEAMKAAYEEKFQALSSAYHRQIEQAVAANDAAWKARVDTFLGAFSNRSSGKAKLQVGHAGDHQRTPQPSISNAKEPVELAVDDLIFGWATENIGFALPLSQQPSSGKKPVVHKPLRNSSLPATISTLMDNMDRNPDLRGHRSTSIQANSESPTICWMSANSPLLSFAIAENNPRE